MGTDLVPLILTSVAFMFVVIVAFMRGKAIESLLEKIEILRARVSFLQSERDALQAKLDFANKHCDAIDEGWRLSLDGWSADIGKLHCAEELIGKITELIERFDEGECEAEQQGAVP